MSKAQIKLTDFTSGFTRVSTNPKIVIATQLEIFLAAANDSSCQAAILKVPSEKKANDRDAFKQAMETAINKGDYFARSDFKASNEELTLDVQTIKAAKTQLSEMGNLFCRLSGQPLATMYFFDNLHKRPADKHHKPHPYHVLNRVFFSAGTLLETSEGWFQVDEGDFLFMKPYMPHAPDFEREDNKDINRLTVLTRSLDQN